MARLPKSFWIVLGLFVGGFAVGLLLTQKGFIAWDDWEHLNQSRWLISTFGLTAPGEDPSWTMKWYGPLWETVMGLFSFVFFGFTEDPLWIRHSVTFALYPVTLWAVYRLSLRAGVDRWTAALASALLFACIRYGGHALANTKDFPFASLYVITTLWLWCALRETYADDDTPVPLRKIATIGAITILPYLIRPPVALHFAVFAAWNAIHAFWLDRSGRKPGERALAVMMPLIAAFVTIVVLHPSIRALGFGAWIESLTIFNKYTSWIGPVTLWGETFRSDQLPWWYAPSWIVVILHPFALAALLAGVWGLVAKSSRDEWRVSGLPSLKLWVVGITALTWGAVFFMNPVLYDEERHLLFLFPPLLLCGALGLAHYSDTIKKSLCATLVVGALWSYGHWARYAYVYKSPLVGDTSGRRFMGDYWGLCVAPMIADLKGRVPTPVDIAVAGPSGNALLEIERLRTSLAVKDPAYDGFRFRELAQMGRPAVVIAINRLLINGQDVMTQLKGLVAAGQAQVVGTQTMEPGEDACYAVLLKNP